MKRYIVLLTTIILSYTSYSQSSFNLYSQIYNTVNGDCNLDLKSFNDVILRKKPQERIYAYRELENVILEESQEIAKLFPVILDSLDNLISINRNDAYASHLLSLRDNLKKQINNFTVINTNIQSLITQPTNRDIIETLVELDNSNSDLTNQLKEYFANLAEIERSQNNAKFTYIQLLHLDQSICQKGLYYIWFYDYNNVLGSIKLSFSKHLNLDINSPEIHSIISDYFNSANLISYPFNEENFYHCDRQKIHLYKKAFANNFSEFFNQFLLKEQYKINFNAYEMVNGKKETLLDYIQIYYASKRFKWYASKYPEEAKKMKEIEQKIIALGGKKGEEL
jgi:hypothetical protein